MTPLPLPVDSPGPLFPGIARGLLNVGVAILTSGAVMAADVGNDVIEIGAAVIGAVATHGLVALIDRARHRSWQHTMDVYATLIVRPGQPALHLADDAGVPTRCIYAVLRRLQTAGLVDSRLETHVLEARPRRTLYYPTS